MSIISMTDDMMFALLCRIAIIQFSLSASSSWLYSPSPCCSTRRNGSSNGSTNGINRSRRGRCLAYDPFLGDSLRNALFRRRKSIIADDETDDESDDSGDDPRVDVCSLQMAPPHHHGSDSTTTTTTITCDATVAMPSGGDNHGVSMVTGKTTSRAKRQSGNWTISTADEEGDRPQLPSDAVTTTSTNTAVTATSTTTTIAAATTSTTMAAAGAATATNAALFQDSSPEDEAHHDIDHDLVPPPMSITGGFFQQQLYLAARKKMLKAQQQKQQQQQQQHYSHYGYGLEQQGGVEDNVIVGGRFQAEVFHAANRLLRRDAAGANAGIHI